MLSQMIDQWNTKTSGRSLYHKLGVKSPTLSYTDCQLEKWWLKLQPGIQTSYFSEQFLQVQKYKKGKVTRDFQFSVESESYCENFLPILQNVDHLKGFSRCIF